MNPVDFHEANTVIAKDQPEYLPLPAHVDQTPQRCVTTCWELTDEELTQLITTKRFWFQQWIFDNGFQPICPSSTKPQLNY
jgi:hypothetical protein